MDWDCFYSIHKNKGVRFHKGRYEAFLCYNQKNVNCGRCLTKNQAENVIIEKRKEIFLSNMDIYQEKLENISYIPNTKHFVSTTGNIYGPMGKQMVATKDRNGYLFITINSKQVYLHQMVAKAFIPNPLNKSDVNHKDGNKQNNNLSNLEWATRSENVLHSYRMGLQNKIFGEDHHNSKFTKEQIKYIRSVHKKGSRIYGSAALSRKFGVDKSTIESIVKYETWRDIQ